MTAWDEIYLFVVICSRIIIVFMIFIIVVIIITVM